MLDYVRIYNFKLIPDRLFEAKGADYNLDYLKGRGGNLPELNADQVLYGLIDKESVIYTSGSGGLFKAGIPIGKIEISKTNKEMNVNFFSDFSQLRFLKIISFKKEVN